MATINLSEYDGFTGITAKGSALTYSTGKWRYAAASLVGGFLGTVYKVSNGYTATFVNPDTKIGAGMTEISYSGAQGWSIKGNASITSVTLGSGNDSVSLGGSDKLYTLNLNGGTNVASVIGNLGTATFGSGNDNLVASSVSGSVTMGSGNDTVSIAAALAGSSIELGAGDNSLVASLGGTNVYISGGTGEDDVSITGTSGGSYTIDLGNGNNSLQADDLKGAQVAVTLGNGDDSVSLMGIGASSNIQLGNGRNTLYASLASTSTNVGITGGSGDDYVSIVGSNAEGGSINLGAGANSIAGSSVGGWQITTGTGNDSIVLEAIGSAVIDAGAGKNIISVKGADGANITTGSGNDSIFVDGEMKKTTITAGDGNDSVFVASMDSDSTLTISGGKNVVSIGSATQGTITLGSSDDSLFISGSASGTAINLGDGKDSVAVSVLADSATLTGGAGDDYVSLNSATGTTIELGDGADTLAIDSYGDATITGGNGKDVFSLGAATNSGTATITDFELGTDLLYTSAANIYSQLTVDGQVSLASGAAVQMGNSGQNFYMVTAGADLKTAQNYVWAGENGAFMDATSFTTNMVMVGTTNDVNEGADTLMGGSGKDTIYAGKGDVAWGGADSDLIVFNAISDSDVQAAVLMAGTGKDTVSYFDGGSAETKDVVYLFSNEITDLEAISTSASTGMTVKLNSSDMLVLSDVKSATSDVVKFRNASGSDYTVDVVTTSSTVTAAENLANYYYRASNTKTARLDFSSVSDSMTLDLGNRMEDNTTFVGAFNEVRASKGDTNILMGAAANAETLVAGGGNTSLWGGGSAADMLMNSSTTQTGVTTFWFGAGDGKDTVQNFKAGSSSEYDAIHFFDGVQFSSFVNNGTNTTITLSDTNDVLTLKNTGSTVSTIRFTMDDTNYGGLQLGVTGKNNTFTYGGDSDVTNFFFGSTGKDTLQVGSDVDTANIWLDGGAGKSYSSIDVVDASRSSGNILIAGVASNETIIGGSGSNTLYGGSGASDDLLQGNSSGTTNFWYGSGDGNDIIKTTTANDKVVFYNTTLDAIASIDVSGGNMKFTMQDGGTLTIQGYNASSVNQFQFSDQSSWTYNYADKSWKLNS